jgi:hypothetical protein
VRTLETISLSKVQRKSKDGYLWKTILIEAVAAINKATRS